LPELEGVSSVWVEPDEAFHPLAGIVHALHMGRGRPVFVCAADLPLLTVEVVRAVLAVDPGNAPAVLPVAGGRPQPLAALYTPAALAGLAEYPADARTSEVVLALEPKLVAIADEDAFFNVNAPEDLLHAGALLSGRSTTASDGPQPNVTA
jgi:molybdopterin-guanine dinucleotide biosynthesis protein A